MTADKPISVLGLEGLPIDDSAAEGRPPHVAPKMPFRRWVRELGWRHLVGIVVGLFAVFPLIYVLSASFNPGGTLTGSNVLFRSFSLDNYIALLNDPARPYAAWYANTMLIGLITAAGTVFLGALAAYSFSRMRFTGRRVGLLSLILVQMFPQMLAVVAIYVLMRGISEVFPAIGLDTQIGLILIYLGGALGVNTYLMYGFFNTVPASIDEAAKIDGAGHARIFFTIILRLVAPILAVIGLLSFIGTTSEFVIASVILQSPEKLTLAVGLYRFVSDETNTNYPIFAAGAVLAAIPVMVLFLWLQKYIVGGLTAGAVK